MNPVSRTKKKRGFYMSKFSYEDKLEIYNEKEKHSVIYLLNIILDKIV